MIEEIFQTVEKIRPKPDKTIAQCPLDTESLKKRVDLILKYPNVGKLLLIGDDDLASIPLSKLSNIDLAVVEFDDRLIEVISANSKAEILKFDLRNIYNDIWPKINTKFDGFLTDPPYTADGMKIFISVGIRNIKVNGLGFIACPYMLDRKESLDLTRETVNFVTMNGCTIEQIIPFFHNYVNSIKSSMIVIRKIKEKNIDFGFLKGFKNFYPIAYSKES